ELLEIVGSTVTLRKLLPGRLGVKNGDIIEVLVDSRGTTWYLTTWGVAREVNGRLERLEPHGPPRAAATPADEDAHGRVWLGTDDGLFRANSTGLEPVAPGILIMDFLNDRDGNLWVGTYGDGLYRFKEAAVRMFTTADGLPGNTILKVLEMHDGA